MQSKPSAVSLFYNAPCRLVTFAQVIPGVRVPVDEMLDTCCSSRVATQTLNIVFEQGYSNWLGAYWSLPSTFGAKRGANV